MIKILISCDFACESVHRLDLMAALFVALRESRSVCQICFVAVGTDKNFDVMFYSCACSQGDD